MPKQQIRKNLEILRSEIDQIDDSKSETKNRLTTLISDIESSIDTEDDTEDQTLLQNLKDAVGHFETEHPRATAILNDIMVTLSNMGI